MENLLGNFSKNSRVTLHSMSIVGVIRKHKDAIKARGFKVTENYPGMTLLLPGINIWATDYKIIVKVRTDRGGYKIDWKQVHIFTKFLESKVLHKLPNGNVQRQWAEDEDELDEALDEILKAAKELSKTVPPAPRRIRSKSKLPPPHKFLNRDYVGLIPEVDGWVMSRAILKKCRVSDIVTIANNLNLVPATQPGTTPWFLIVATTMTNGGLRFVSNGENYYAVTLRSGKVRADWQCDLLSAHDQKMVKVAMKLFVSKMEETE